MGVVCIEPGEDIQAIVDLNPAGTRFLLRSGVHSRQQIVPKSGNAFLGDRGAVLDGGGDTEYAFRGQAGIDGVTVQGLEIRNYAPPLQWAAVRAVETQNWVVTDNDIHHNTGGVRIGHSIVVSDNHIHDNVQTGIMGQGDHALIEDNEVSYNNADLGVDLPPELAESGGMKITYSRGVTIRGNHVHHNGKTGIWLDIDNIDIVIEDNLIEDNYRRGIFYEISYDAVIRGNTVSRNGVEDSGRGYHRGGIVIASSPNVEVHGNVVSGNGNGITATQQDRGSGEHGPRLLENLDVHDNTVIQAVGVSGVARDRSVDDSVFTSQNNRFDSNVYHLGRDPNYFRWMRRDISESGWKGYGNDVNGEFNRH